MTTLRMQKPGSIPSYKLLFRFKEKAITSTENTLAEDGSSHILLV